MKKQWLKFGIIGVLALGALSLALTGVAYAQEDQLSTAEEVVAFGRRGFGHGLHSQVALEAAAEALGMTTDELTDQLWGGKTLADLAEEKGVDLADVRAAVEAALETEFRDSIAQAVTDGTITQEHADWLLEGLDKGFISGPGKGLGGFRMHGMFGPPLMPEAVAPSGDA